MKKAIYFPLIAFIVAFLVHAGWAVAKAPESCVNEQGEARAPAEAKHGSIAEPGESHTGEEDLCQESLSLLLKEKTAGYFAAQDHFLGFSYALLAAFTTYALLKLVENRRRAIAAASGGLLLTGGVYAITCFAIGCCGSPMLAVYLGVLGSHLAGFEKPILAGITALSVGAGWWWCRRCCPRDAPCCPPDGPCHASRPGEHG